MDYISLNGERQRINIDCNKHTAHIHEKATKKGPYIPAGVTVKNTERLKHETAFHNPKNLNPDEILNEILTNYFIWLDAARA